MKRNIPVEAEHAVEKFREFHRYDPQQIVVGPSDFQIPERVYRAGPGVHVCYQSSKVDPETLRRPRQPVDYIHEFDAGVVCYLASDHDTEGDEVSVPDEFRRVPALTRLGICLGFCFQDAGAPIEVESRRPMPELYTVPDGHCLLVVQSRKTVLAMMWGGALGVFARGIDG
jgi:hypothetical protein